MKIPCQKEEHSFTCTELSVKHKEGVRKSTSLSVHTSLTYRSLPICAYFDINLFLNKFDFEMFRFLKSYEAVHICHELCIFVIN